MIVTLLALAAAPAPTPAPTPSFNCQRARLVAEKIVCGDAQLARMDRYVADRYHQHQAYWRQRDRATWRRNRSLQRFSSNARNRCTDRDCVLRAYKDMVHRHAGGPTDRFYKRDDDLGYLHVEPLADGWVVIDLLAYDRPFSDPQVEIDFATALLPLRGDVAEEGATPDACGLRMTRAGDGWQVERPAATATWIDGCGLLGGAKSAAGHYAPRPYDRKDGGAPR